jgi:hypothetical protein
MELRRSFSDKTNYSCMLFLPSLLYWFRKLRRFRRLILNFLNLLNLLNLLIS